MSGADHLGAPVAASKASRLPAPDLGSHVAHRLEFSVVSFVESMSRFVHCSDYVSEHELTRSRPPALVMHVAGEVERVLWMARCCVYI